MTTDQPDVVAAELQGQRARTPVRILLVDASTVVQRLFRQALTERGHDVVPALDLREAYEVLRRGKIDVVLTDVNVGEESGLEIITFLMGKGESVPVLVLSTVEDAAVRRDVLRKGATDLLFKSAPVELVEGAIQKALAKIQKAAPRLLIVDDDPLVRKLLKAIFEEDGMSVMESPGALAAWETIHRHRISLILCDLYMADYSGLDLLRNMRAQKVAIPVILITGRPTEEASTQARALGAVAVVAKSGDLQPLKETVHQVLENFQMASRGGANGVDGV